MNLGLNASAKKKSNTPESDTDTIAEEDECILEEMDTDEWASVVTDLVDDMRHVPNPQILLCADPMGAVHQAAELAEREKRAKGSGEAAFGDKKEDKKSAGVGSTEYRKIYKEFWYVLAHVALNEGGMATTASSEFGSSDEEDAAIVRLDTELVKLVLLRDRKSVV